MSARPVCQSPPSLSTDWCQTQTSHQKTQQVAQESLSKVSDLAIAVRDAAAGSHVESLRFLLSDGRRISQPDLAIAVRDAAAGGHVDSLRLLLRGNMAISQDDLGAVVKAAAAGGHVDSLRFLLSDGRRISEDDLGGAVRAAAEGDHVESLRFLLSDGRRISEHDLGISVCLASNGVHFTCIEFLIQQGPVPDWAKEAAINKATGANQERIRNILYPAGAEFLPSNEREISHSDLTRAVMAAAAGGHVDSLRLLLRGNMAISQDDLGAVVKAAAAGDHVESLRFLLSDDRTISDHDLGMSVCLASNGVHLTCIEFLIQQGPVPDWAKEAAINNAAGANQERIRNILRPTGAEFLPSNEREISHSDLRRAVMAAAAGGHVDSLIFLLSDDREISQPDLGGAVMAAAAGGHVDSLRFLLREHITIGQGDLRAAIIAAAAGGHVDSLRFLLREHITIGQGDLIAAIIAAAAGGHVDSLMLLLSDDRAIHSECLGWVFMAAAAGGHVDALRFVLGDEGEISQPDLGGAGKADAAGGYLAALRFLLSDDREISQTYLGEAVMAAAEGGHVEALRFLLSDDREISQTYLGEAVMTAAEGDHLDILSLLLRGKRTISQTYLGGVVKAAAARGHVDALRFLLSDDREISQTCLGEAVMAAAEGGHVEALRFLLSDDRTILQDDWEEAIVAATAGGHFESLRFLLSGNRTIRQDQLGLFVITAANQGLLTYVELFIRHGPIREGLRTAAITNASGPDRDRIRDLLRFARTVPDPAQEAFRPNTDGNDLYLKLSEVKANPAVYLHNLYERGLPDQIYVIEEDGHISPAIDIGGITKQFITSLGEAIVDQNLLRLNDKNMPTSTLDDPVLQQLGRFFSMVYERNLDRTDKILTGHIIHESFLQIVQAIAKENDQAGFQKMCAVIADIDPALRSIANFLKTPSLETKNAYLASWMKEPAKEFVENDPLLQEAREHLEPFYLAATNFLAGVTPRFKVELIRESAQELARSIQGESLSVLGVLQSLYLEPVGALPLRSQQIIRVLASQDQKAIQELRASLRQEQPKDILSTGFANQVDWLVAVIASKDLDKEEDKVWLNTFLFAVTGKKTMSTGMTIRLQQTWKNGIVFEMHTCFNGLDLPDIALTHGAFLSALDFAIEMESYNIA